MNQEEIINIAKIKDKVFIKLSQTIDFTKDICFYLKIYTDENSFQVEINKSSLVYDLYLLKEAIFDKKIIVFCWNIKDLFSYILYNTGNHLEYFCKIMDLKFFTTYLTLEEPKNYTEAINCIKQCKEIIKIYDLIYNQLITKVIPKIENSIILKDNKLVYSYYDITGQANGRMACQIPGDNFYNPHSLDDDFKKSLKSGFDKVFISFDFINMEASVLQWLSQDQEMLSFIEKDFYKALYENITNKPCDTEEKRNKIKKIFLPVIYGQSSNSLAKEINISNNAAIGIVNKLKKLFEKAFNWIENIEVVNGLCVDIFGRKRIIEEYYKSRNFVVQSSAALICLNKLVDLSKQMDIVCSIHDEYIVICKERESNDLEILGRNILESESDLYPGLLLKVKSKIGKTL